MKRLNLSNKIFLMMSILVFFIFAIYSVIFTNHLRKIDDELIGRESINTLHSIDTSISSVIRNADNYSKMLIADDNVRELMSRYDMYLDTKGQQQVINRIYSILQFSESADAVWLINNQGQKLKAGSVSSLSKDNDNDIYEELKKPYGRSKVVIVFDEEGSGLSLVRAYNDINDFSNLGIIGVDISVDRIRDIVASSIDYEREKFFIVNENNEVVFCSDDILKEIYLNNIKWDSESNPEYLDKIKVDGIEYIVSGVRFDERDWKAFRFNPVISSTDRDGLISFNLIIIIIVGIIMLISALIVASMLTKPIQALLAAMKSEKEGTPGKINDNPILNDFKELFAGYNKMVDRINDLIEETIDRQKRIRQVELNEIQEQMKPHFLYNTLDSIEALAMMGDTETVCKLIEALGGFYRKSVSGGREMLTIKEEVEMVSDYARIMHIRFGNSFSCKLEADGACSMYLIPKLTIQPLVENAFQHGIRGRMEYGYIDAKVYIKDEKLCISVCDNGVGIPEEIKEELVNNREVEGKGSLGLRGTIKRLRLTYGDDFSFTIGEGHPSKVDLYIKISALEL